jgi:hypothetical protein
MNYYNAQTEVFHSSITVDASANTPSQQIAEQLVYKMLSDITKYLDIKEDRHLYSGDKVYRTSLTVAPPSVRQVMLEGEYVYKNIKFNLDDINTALFQTYPERFL